MGTVWIFGVGRCILVRGKAGLGRGSDLEARPDFELGGSSDVR